LAELRLTGEQVELLGADGAQAAMPAAAELLDAGGTLTRVPFTAVEPHGTAQRLLGNAGPMAITQDWQPHEAGWDVELTARWQGSEPWSGGLRLGLELAAAGEPWWMVPGIFYGPNRLPGNQRRFPGWRAATANDELLAAAWAFRGDRAALPAAIGWTDTAMAGLCADERSPLGPVGIGFGSDADTERVWIDAPWREEPVAYVAAEKAGPAQRRLHTWQPGEAATLRFSVVVGGRDRHGYAAFVRAMDQRRRADNPLRPWITPQEAAGLTAHGLHRWHYRPADHALYECVAFDRELAGADGELGDRAAMHVAWVSGIPYAGALLRHARRVGNQAYAAGAIDVIDFIVANPAPCGTFWGEWRRDTGWCGGWNGDRDRLHARTLAEATLFLLRAVLGERRAGQAHLAWEAAVRRNLAFVAAAQRQDGNLGSYYDARSGEVLGWDGAAGLTWIAALAEGSRALDEHGWLAAAQRAGSYYRRFVDEELIYGAPEDVHLTPTSEDGYAAVMAYVALAEADAAQPAWLELARRAAEWSLTFRFSWNVPFAATTLLGAYDYRTRGGDVASPSNQHLHAYGLVCLPEMVRLARRTDDAWLLERTRDHLAWALQFVARADGDFNAYRGMVSERFHHTDWEQPQGMLLTLSHAWSVGMILGACEAVLTDYRDAFPA